MKSLIPRNIASSLSLLAVITLIFTTTSARAADEKETELGGKMKVIAKSVKQLKTQIADPTKQNASIDLLEAAKKSAGEAKSLTPSKATDIPEADRAKFIAEYQGQMDKLIDQLAKIEDAVRAGKYSDAKKFYDELGPMKRQGHEKFQADQE